MALQPMGRPPREYRPRPFPPRHASLSGSLSGRRADRPDAQRDLLAREGEVFVAHPVARDEFAPRLEFVLLPVRVIEVFIEHDDRARLKAPAESVEDVDRGGVKVA